MLLFGVCFILYCLYIFTHLFHKSVCIHLYICIYCTLSVLSIYPFSIHLTVYHFTHNLPIHFCLFSCLLVHAMSTCLQLFLSANLFPYQFLSQHTCIPKLTHQEKGHIPLISKSSGIGQSKMIQFVLAPQ